MERNYDDFENNRLLRKRFREEKVLLQKEDRPKNFALKLVDLSKTELRQTQNVDFKGLDAFKKNRKEKRDRIRTESIFQSKSNVDT